MSDEPEVTAEMLKELVEDGKTTVRYAIEGLRCIEAESAVSDQCTGISVGVLNPFDLHAAKRGM